MSLPFFLLLSAIGSAVWTSLLAGAGYLLGKNYEAVEAYVGPVSNVVLGLIVIVYIYRVVTFEAKGEPDASEPSEAEG